MASIGSREDFDSYYATGRTETECLITDVYRSSSYCNFLIMETKSDES